MPSNGLAGPTERSRRLKQKFSFHNLSPLRFEPGNPAFEPSPVFVTAGWPFPFFWASMVLDDKLWPRIRRRRGTLLKGIFFDSGEESWLELDARTLSIEDFEEQGFVPWIKLRHQHPPRQSRL